MATSSPIGAMARAVGAIAVLTGVLLSCTPAAPPGAGASTASPGPSAAVGGASPTVPGRDAPPDALLAAEGGDPVPGQLGTYTWLETGSDSPWLPGAPIAVGAGEPMKVSLLPDGDIRAWAARYVPAGAAGPAGAITLGEGSGIPAFDAPAQGAWTLEVFIEFAAGVGDARYFWRLAVE